MTNPTTTQKGRPALSAPIRVTDAAARRLDALAARLALRKVDLTRVALAIGIEALERAADDAPASGANTEPAQKEIYP